MDIIVWSYTKTRTRQIQIDMAPLKNYWERQKKEPPAKLSYKTSVAELHIFHVEDTNHRSAGVCVCLLQYYFKSTPSTGWSIASINVFWSSAAPSVRNVLYGCRLFYQHERTILFEMHENGFLQQTLSSILNLDKQISLSNAFSFAHCGLKEKRKIEGLSWCATLNFKKGNQLFR